MLKLNNNTRNSEIDKITKSVYFECFHILSYQNPKLHAKLALCGEKNDITGKVSFDYFSAC